LAESVEVIEFQTTEAYSSLDRTREQYKKRSLSRVEKEEVMYRIKHNNNETLSLLLDIEKAFNKVWITSLIYKLIKEEIPAHFIHTTYNYLSNITFTVSHGNSVST
jgi:hypothetical protein